MREGRQDQGGSHVVFFAEGQQCGGVFVGVQLYRFDYFVERSPARAVPGDAESLARRRRDQQVIEAADAAAVGAPLVKRGHDDGVLQPVPHVAVERLHAVRFAGRDGFGHEFDACFVDAEPLAGDAPAGPGEEIEGF